MIKLKKFTIQNNKSPLNEINNIYRGDWLEITKFIHFSLQSSSISHCKVHPLSFQSSSIIHWKVCSQWTSEKTGGKKNHFIIEEDKVYVEVKLFIFGFHFLLNGKFTVWLSASKGLAGEGGMEGSKPQEQTQFCFVSRKSSSGASHPLCLAWLRLFSAVFASPRCVTSVPICQFLPRTHPLSIQEAIDFCLKT